MPTPIFQIDAFTAEPFRGNPAAVCFLGAPRPAEWMQRVAAEMNLSETAFVEERGDGFGLRWFTPAVEVPLCGHATLASAHALWEAGRVPLTETIRFLTRSGWLSARRSDGRIELDLPAAPPIAGAAPAGAAAALGIVPRYAGRAVEGGSQADACELPNYLFEIESDAAVRALRPDFAALRREEGGGWIVTARSGSDEQDFVSRFFAPRLGLDEDPVTGAAHCTLVPFWSERLGRTRLVGYQASARGGRVYGELQGDRVKLAGDAVTVLRGELIG